MENVKNLELEGYWAELGPKFCLLRQSQKKQNEETEQNWNGKEKFGMFSHVF